jgi:hypothetical protein
MGTAPQSLGELMVAMQPKPGDTHVSVGDILSRIGDRSFAPAILVIGLILVSPISGIPGTPTLGALIVLICAVQGILGRGHLWLPAVLMRRRIKAERMAKGITWLARPAAWIDRHSHGRFAFLTATPFAQLAFGVITLIALTWPFLELLPFVTSFGAGAVSLIAFGLMTRDGAYVIAGYAVSGGLAAAAISVAMEIF